MPSQQEKATRHIQSVLKQRGLDLQPGIYLVAEDAWQLFEHKEVRSGRYQLRHLGRSSGGQVAVSILYLHG